MRIAGLLLLLLFMGGCGYHVQGRKSHLPADIRSVLVELFVNRTLEPYLENEVTNAVSERFSRGRAFDLAAGADRAQAALSGIVTAYETRPISYNEQDAILEYRSTMTVDVVLRRTGSGEIVWKGAASWNEEYPANPDKAAQEDNEAAAIRVIAERIADELYSRLVDNF